MLLCPAVTPHVVFYVRPLASELFFFPFVPLAPKEPVEIAYGSASRLDDTKAWLPPYHSCVSSKPRELA